MGLAAIAVLSLAALIAIPLAALRLQERRDSLAREALRRRAGLS